MLLFVIICLTHHQSPLIVSELYWKETKQNEQVCATRITTFDSAAVIISHNHNDIRTDRETRSVEVRQNIGKSSYNIVHLWCSIFIFLIGINVYRREKAMINHDHAQHATSNAAGVDCDIDDRRIMSS